MGKELLDYVFGSDSQGATESERARTSSYLFVRSQDHLSLDKPSATGRRLTALEAFEAYGFEVLREVMDYGSAILPASEREPAATLTSRREALGLTVDDIVGASGLSAEQIWDCENSATRSPIREVESIARVLGLDDRLVSTVPGAGGDDGLAVRLRTLGKGSHGLSPRTVLVLSEAAWVIQTEARLQQVLNIERRLLDAFEPSDNYGSRDYPVWLHGYYLAERARELLGIASDAPIESLREVCERLRVPLLRSSLPAHVAGATVNSSGLRGIVVNTEGHNTNVWIQRATIAHELGHLFWDPEEKLDQVVVDHYEVVDELDREARDYVEARANAFAIAFLAPVPAVLQTFNLHSDPSRGLRAVMEQFGISYTAARNHVWNATERSMDRKLLTVKDCDPTDDWRGREAYTDDYFPLSTTSQLRRGYFAGVVVAAEKQGLISRDTACEYLQAKNLDDYAQAANGIADLFPVRP